MAIFAKGEGIVFWLTLGAFAALLAMHATYWLVTHPVNNFWLEGFDMNKAGARYFGADPLGRAGAHGDWTGLRDRWEWSHVVRAAFGTFALTLLVTAVAL